MKFCYLPLGLMLTAGLYAPSQAQPPTAALPEMQPQVAPKNTELSIEQLDEIIGEVPPLVLEADGESLASVLDEVALQTGVKFNIFDSQKTKPVKIDAKTATPFWDVMLQAMRSTGSRFYRHPKSFTIVDNSKFDFLQPSMTGLGSSTGAFYVLASKVARPHEQILGDDRTGPARTLSNVPVQIELQIFAHPRARMVDSQELALIESVDDIGKTYRPRLNYNGYYGSARHTLNIYEVSPGAKVLKSVKGEYRLGVILKSELWEVPGILEARKVTKTSAGWNFVLESVVQEKGDYVLYLTAEDPTPRATKKVAGSEKTPVRDAILTTFESIRLLDAAGKPLRGRASRRDVNNKIHIKVVFSMTDFAGLPSAGEPVTMSWDMPSEVALVSVPFEFKDIPLP
ncbi:MAG TPA: hypothetical protein VF719_03130 [Abditibacteriaceae bacterium]|jgi:hypothetical protein